MSRLTNGPVLIITPADAAMLWQQARLDDLRLKHRGGDRKFYDLLVSVWQLSMQRPDTARAGIETRHPVASEDRDVWTVNNLTAATGRAGRTIRNDIAIGTLPATKTGNAWCVTTADAQTYIDTYTKH